MCKRNEDDGPKIKELNKINEKKAKDKERSVIIGESWEI